MLNIKTKAVAQTSDLHLRDAADELMFDENGEPVTITLYGPGTKVYAKAQAAQQNRLIDLLKKKGKTEQSADEKAASNAEFFAACTKSFNNFQYEGMAPGFDQYKAAYMDREIGFVAEQVGKHLGDWGNFTNGSATS